MSAAPASSGDAPPGVVSLLTDFGPGSVYVGQLHATIARLAPAVRVVDLAHDVPFASTEAASYLLRRSFAHFAPGTVHVVVVDPGVGTERAILAARAGGHVFVAPDTGVLGTVLALDPGAEVRRIESRGLMNERVSKTFNGRDVMAPVAARLASGTALESVGPVAVPRPPPAGPVRSASGIDGRVLIVDRFGNLVTDIPAAAMDDFGGPRRVRLRVGAAFLDGVATTFADVPEGMALVYVGSGDHLEVAVNGGRAADRLRLGVGDRVRLERRA